MVTINKTIFTSYNISEDESLAATIFTDLQECYLQTALATIAQALALLEPVPNDYQSFVQQQSYLRGKLDILQQLLDSSLEARKISQEMQDQCY